MSTLPRTDGRLPASCTIERRKEGQISNLQPNSYRKICWSTASNAGLSPEGRQCRRCRFQQQPYKIREFQTIWWNLVQLEHCQRRLVKNILGIRAILFAVSPNVTASGSPGVSGAVSENEVTFYCLVVVLTEQDCEFIHCDQIPSFALLQSLQHITRRRTIDFSR